MACPRVGGGSARRQRHRSCRDPHEPRHYRGPRPPPLRRSSELYLGIEKDLSPSLRDPERAAAVRRPDLGDPARDPALERLARAVRGALQVPVALACVAESEGRVLVGTDGLADTPPGEAQALLQRLCRFALEAGAERVADDARRQDPAFAELGFAACAVVPLLGPTGVTLGALCALDHAPRRWTPGQLAVLRDLAAFVTPRLTALTAPPQADGGSAARGYDALPVMLWMVAPDGTCDYVNARWLEFTGRPLGAELGCGWTDRIHPDDRQACLEQFRKALTEREPLRHEYRMRRNDDQYRWLLDVAVPRFDAAGEFLGLIGCSTDVTDRRQLEQRLVQAERAQAIGQLAGGIAHDFNNLLTGNLGHVALILEEP